MKIRSHMLDFMLNIVPVKQCLNWKLYMYFCVFCWLYVNLGLIYCVLSYSYGPVCKDNMWRRKSAEFCCFRWQESKVWNQGHILQEKAGRPNHRRGIVWLKYILSLCGKCRSLFMIKSRRKVLYLRHGAQMWRKVASKYKFSTYWLFWIFL